FQNTLATMKIKGKDIVASLETGVNDIENGAGKFPQVAGLKYTIDMNVPPDGGRVKDVQVKEGDNWVPIDPEKVYAVATNDFMRKAGDGYALLASNAIDPYDYGPGKEEGLGEYIANNAPYQPKDDGRVAAIAQSSKRTNGLELA